MSTALHKMATALVIGGLVACSSSDGGKGGGIACTTDCEARAIVEGGQVNALSIAVAGDHAYWGVEPLLGQPNTLREVATSGGPVKDVLGDGAERLQVASNGTSIFFVRTGSNGGLARLDTGGDTPVILVAKPGTVESVAANATHVFWSTGDEIMRVPVTGGTPETVASAPEIERIALDETNVYYAEGINNGLQTVAIEGAPPKTPRTLAAQHDPMIFAVSGGYAYFASQRDHTIKRVPVAGGSPELLVTTDDEPLVLGADPAGVYYGSQQGVSRVPLGGGTAQPLAPPDGQSHMVTAMTFDATHVYWIDYSYQAIRKAPK